MTKNQNNRRCALDLREFDVTSMSILSHKTVGSFYNEIVKQRLNR